MHLSYSPTCYLKRLCQLKLMAENYVHIKHIQTRIQLLSSISPFNSGRICGCFVELYHRLAAACLRMAFFPGGQPPRHPVARFSRALVCCGNSIVLGTRKQTKTQRCFLEPVKARVQRTTPEVWE
jgi:hypothetical protein